MSPSPPWERLGNSAWPKKKDLLKLTGLRHVTILLQLNPMWSSRAVLTSTVAKDLDETRKALKRIPWETAVVCVTSYDKYDSSDRQVLFDGDFRADSRATERALLQDWDEEIRQQQEEKKHRRAEKERKAREAEAALETKTQAEAASNQQRNADRTRRGLRRVKVASYRA